MKKFGKFLLAAASVTVLAGGAYYFIKNIINRDSDQDFDDFDDDFDDFGFNEEEDADTASQEAREYVTINLAADEGEADVQKTSVPSDNDIEASEEE